MFPSLASEISRYTACVVIGHKKKGCIFTSLSSVLNSSCRTGCKGSHGSYVTCGVFCNPAVRKYKTLSSFMQLEYREGFNMSCRPVSHQRDSAVHLIKSYESDSGPTFPASRAMFICCKESVAVCYYNYYLWKLGNDLKKKKREFKIKKYSVSFSFVAVWKREIFKNTKLTETPDSFWVFLTVCGLPSRNINMAIYSQTLTDFLSS